MYERVYAALQEGATVVAANRRLARYLLKHFERQQMQAGRTAWPTPEINSWPSWVEHLWDESRFTDGGASRLTLLSEQRCILLWEQLIARSGRSALGTPVPLLARNARKAWGLVQDWGIADADDWDGYELTGDQRAFCGWFRAYRQQLQDNHWIDAESLCAVMAADIERGLPVSHQQLLFVGFDNWAPARRKLLAAMESSGVVAEYFDPHVEDPQLSVVRADNQQHEWLQAASWARAVSAANPEAEIAVVLPDLAAHAADVARVFRDVLVPDWRCGQQLDSVPLNISYGRPLADYPLIDTLLRLFDLCDERVEFNELSLLLRSHWLTGAETESQQRAMLELKLRANCQADVYLPEVLAQCHKNAPLFATTLKVLLSAAADSKKRSAADWVKCFGDFARQAGWPGAGAPDSETWQLLDKWQALLRSFSDAGDHLGKINRAEAVGLLRRMSRQQLFQPQGPRHGIHVMGVLEAAGHEFDYLWVCGMARELWPQAGSPEPFIPVELQRQAALPDCDATQSLEYAQGVLQRLRHSAAETIFSWPAQADEQPYAISPLIADLPESQCGELFISWNVAGIAVADMEVVSADPPPPVPDGTKVSGGAQLFRSQALSPATGFIRHRLGGQTLETPPVGLSAKQRGIVVHDVLQSFYERYATTASLQALGEEECSSVVDGLLEQQLSKLPGAGEAFMQRLMKIEQECLGRRITDFIAIDRKRESFSVEECEQKREVSVGPLRLSLKLDRLDKLPDGGEMVIDYKTGKAERKNWNPEKPVDLQLPLYATRLAKNPAAIAFVRLSAEGAAFVGVGNDEAQVAGVSEPGTRRGQVRFRPPYADGTDDRNNEVIDTWEALLSAWDVVLVRLAEEFAAGDFSVDPENPNESRGQLAALTRIYELDSLTDAEESTQ